MSALFRGQTIADEALDDDHGILAEDRAVIDLVEAYLSIPDDAVRQSALTIMRALAQRQ